MDESITLVRGGSVDKGSLGTDTFKDFYETIIASKNDNDWIDGITGGGKGNNMLYLSGIQNEKVLTKDIIDKVVSEVEKRASELEK